MTPHMLPIEYPEIIPLNNVYMYNHHKLITEPIRQVVRATTSAKAFFKRYPNIDRRFSVKLGCHIHAYYSHDASRLNASGGMPFKTRTSNDTAPSMTSLSKATARLYELAVNSPEVKFHLPMPCLKNSTLTFAEVVEIYSQLPNNVHVYMISKG